MKYRSKSHFYDEVRRRILIYKLARAVERDNPTVQARGMLCMAEGRLHEALDEWPEVKEYCAHAISDN